MEYRDACKFLDDLQFFKIKLGLDSMRGFLDSLGQPHAKIKFIHIAGTNGKGSTAVSLLNICGAAGYKVGMYTSPHLSSVRERFRINDNYISESDFARNADRIIEVLDGRQITYFEFTTTLALLWFAEQEVDFAILEVGMGGRLDATNVVTPLFSIITNVSMDHEAYLGDTLAKVSFEKAGVIKKDVPVVSAVADDVSRKVVVERAREIAAPLYLLGVDFSCASDISGCSWEYEGINQDFRINGLKLSLPGEHQASNASLAIAAVELLNGQGFTIKAEAIKKGLQNTCWPGRLEYIAYDSGLGVYSPANIKEDPSDAGQENVKPCYLLDGAHNPAGVASLKMVLEEYAKERSVVCIWASMADKDVANSLLPIAPLFSHIIITRPESERSALPEEIKKILPQELQGSVHCVAGVKEAVARASEVANIGDIICVAGSLYLIGAVRKILLGELVP